MILFATQNFLPAEGGTQRYVTGLADALAGRGRAIEVYCDAASHASARAVDAARSYPIVRFGGPRPWLRWRKAKAVIRRLDNPAGLPKVTALVTDTWKSLEQIPSAALGGVRVFCLAHGSEFLVPRGGTKERRLRACLAKVDVLAANSHFTADLARPFAPGGTDVRVMLPGTEPPHGAAPTLAPRADNAPLRILTIARLEPRKGIDTVLHALPALRDAHPGIHYDVIGKGDDAARLAALAQRLGLSATVTFHGYISDDQKAALIRGADVFALPNRREPNSVEGFGIVFLEAAAFGIPSVAGQDGGTSDAVLDGRTGLVVDGGDEKAVGTALAALLSDKDTRSRMGAAAHVRFWSTFAWETAVTRFEQALRVAGKP